MMVTANRGSMEEVLERERAARHICSELNNFVELKPTLRTVLRWIHQISGCEAVAIRLHDDEDYPYYVYDGFSDSFIKKENSLCARDAGGRRIPSPGGEGYLLDCMCGNIIHGRFDPSQPFFTQKGSFWSNGTTALLASTTEEERQARTRNYCNACGYESVALVPIKVRGDHIGLIQLNDRRTGVYSETMIATMEMIGEQIGLAVQNRMIHEKVASQKRELERSNAELEQFAYVASHDLQEPLRMVSSFLGLLAQEYRGKLDEDADTYIDFAVDGAKRMQALIRDLLQYSRVGSSGAPPEPTALPGILQGVLRDLAPVIAESDAEVELSDLPTVPVVPSQAARLFQNLIDNAIHYRHSDRRVRIHISAVRRDRLWEFLVQDNGIGIEARDAEIVFGLFKRLRVVERTSGSGLGLAICKKIVQTHGGQIWVESEPGVGSTFHFTLPAGP